MGKFAELLFESGAFSPIKRKFTVHAKDKQGKEYTYDHESYSPKSIHGHPRFKDDGHTLIAIKQQDGKDVTNESTQIEESREHQQLSGEAHRLYDHKQNGEHTHAEVLEKEMTAKHGKEAMDHIKNAHKAKTESNAAFHKTRAKILDHQANNPNDSIGQSHTHLLANDSEYTKNEKLREQKTLERQEHMAKAERASFVHNHKHLD